MIRLRERSRVSSTVCSRFYILLTTLVLVMVVSCSAPKRGSFAGIQRNFVPEATLSPGELKQVIELANRCGISEVAEVYSYNIHPTASCGFGVKSPEIIRGREVSFLVLLIDHRKWVRARGAQDGAQESVGEFWVQSGTVRTNVLTTFPIAGATVRARVSPNLDLATADRIVEFFKAGRVKYKDPELKEKLGKVYLSQLDALTRSSDGTAFSISFSCADWCGVSLTSRWMLMA